jgi:putative membrane protein
MPQFGGAVDFTNYFLSVLISLVIGLVGFIFAYKIFDWMTPGVRFSDQLKADNRSVAIFLAGLFIGLGLLLGNAIK